MSFLNLLKVMEPSACQDVSNISTLDIQMAARKMLQNQEHLDLIAKAMKEAQNLYHVHTIIDFMLTWNQNEGGREGDISTLFEEGKVLTCSHHTRFYVKLTWNQNEGGRPSIKGKNFSFWSVWGFYSPPSHSITISSLYRCLVEPFHHWQHGSNPIFV